jgi:hypothetical protein
MLTQPAQTSSRVTNAIFELLNPIPFAFSSLRSFLTRLCAEWRNAMGEVVCVVDPRLRLGIEVI